MDILEDLINNFGSDNGKTFITNEKVDNLLRNLTGIKQSELSKVITWINFQDKVVPLQLLWMLQKANLLQFTTYIYQNPKLIPSLSESFRDIIWSIENVDHGIQSAVINDLLGTLVNIGNYSDRRISKPCQKLLHLVVKQVIDKLQGDQIVLHSPMLYLDGLYHTQRVVGFKLRSFCILHLRMLVQHESDAVKLNEAIVRQAEYYTSSKVSPVVLKFYRKIFEMLCTEDIISEYKCMVSNKNQQYNWKWLLTSVAIMIGVRSEYAEAMKKTIDIWIGAACSAYNSQLLSVALLCARQCCAENNQIFGSYSTWFGSLQIRSASAFNFFIQFLSQLVPSEPALCLKIHLNKVPTPPSHCLATLSDYITLAKTRLSDLNETTDYIGLFSEYLTTEKEGRESDVAKVVLHFTRHQEVMKTVLEASVFRRQFYEKIFLPELLKVSASDDADRGKLIQKLNSMGKVPAYLFRQWNEL